MVLWKITKEIVNRVLIIVCLLKRDIKEGISTTKNMEKVHIVSSRNDYLLKWWLVKWDFPRWSS